MPRFRPSAHFQASATVRRQLRRASLSAALALCICGSASAQTAGLEAFNAYVDDLSRLGIEVENGVLDYNETTDTLTVTDSVMTLSGRVEDLPLDDTDPTPDSGTALTFSLSLSADTVTITGLAADGNVYSADSWTYSDDTRFRLYGEALGSARLDVEARMTGLSTTAYTFTLPQIPNDDPARPVSRWLPFAAAALQTSFTDMTADSTAITFEAHSLKNGDERLLVSGNMQLDNFLMANVADGRTGQYGFDRLSQTVLTRDEASGQMLLQTTRQGRTIYQDMDNTAILALLDPTVSETGEEMTLIGYGSMSDYESTRALGNGASIDFTAGSTTLRDLTIIKRDNNILALLDQLLTEQMPAADDLIIDALQLHRAFAIEDGRISNVAIRFTSPNPDLNAEMTIEELAVSDVNASGIGEMMIAGINAPDLPEGASIKLDWAAIANIEFADFQPMKTMIRQLVQDPEFGEQNPLQVARAFMPRSFGYEIAGLDITAPGTGRTQIGKSELTIASTVPPIPTSLFSKNEELRIPVDAIEDAETQAMLRDIGLDEVVWSDETRLYWDEVTNELRLERLEIRIEGIGTVEASVRFANVPKFLFEDPAGQGQIALILAQFVDARISLIDDGFTENGLASIAERQTIPADIFKQVLVNEAAEAAAHIQSAAFTDMVRTAVSDFLENPGQITLTMTPDSPVPLAQILGSMAAPQTLPDLLNIQVTAN